MKKILAIILSVLFFSASGQVYTPIIANYTISGKPIGFSQATPSDGRSEYFDPVNFLYRPFQSTTEVLTFLSIAKYRAGNVIYVVDSGGTLNSNGTYTNPHNIFYMFRDGTADVNLVKMYMFGEGSGGGGPGVTTVTATNGSGLIFTITNPTTTPNISIATAAGGDASGPLNLLSVNKFNGLLPSYYLNYNNLSNLPTIPAQFNPIAGAGITITGTYPNITFATSGSGTGFTTTGYGLIALSSSTVAIDSQNYRKVDSMYTTNDSTLIYVLNNVSHSLQIRGGVPGTGGGGAGTVTNFSFVNANGVTGSVSNPTSIPALTLTLTNITPTTVNALTLAAITDGFTIQGGTTSRTLTVTGGNATVRGTNTGDVTLTGQTYLTIAGQVITVGAVDLSGTNATGTLAAARFGALTGDVTNSAGSYATTISNNVVTNAKLAQMSSLTLKGNNTGGTANALDLTVAQVNAILPVFTSSLNGSVPFSGGGTTNFLRADGTWAAAGGGGGSPNTSVGGFYRVAINGTNNIKSLKAGYGVLIDSATTNVVNFKVDTSIIAPIGIDSIYIKNTGAAGIGLAGTSGDTLLFKKLVAGANITLTLNADSSVTITSSGGGGGGGITLVGLFDSQSPSSNGAVISGSSIYFQSASGSNPGMVNNSAQTFSGAKTFSASPTISTLTALGGVYYGNSSGTMLQTGSGTSGATLHGGSSPSFQFITFATDLAAGTILSTTYGGTGTNSPGLVAGTGITITGTWPNNTISATTGGSVTSVAASGGTTGLSFTGSPITSTGTLTLGGSLNVSNGGTGQTSLTPFSLMAGGSTSTGAMQQVAGLGTTGQILISNGSGALPTWQSAPFYTSITSISDSSYSLNRANGTKDTIVFSGSGGGGAIPTLQQVLTAGSTLTTANAIAYGANQLTFSGSTFVLMNNGVKANGIDFGSASTTATTYFMKKDSSVYLASDATAGTVSVFLPPQASMNSGAFFFVKKTDASANKVRLFITGGTATIDGAASYDLTTQYQCVAVIADPLNFGNYHVVFTNGSGGGGGSGGGIGVDTVQSYSSGTTLTQNASTNYIQVNPSSTQSTLTITTLGSSGTWHTSNDIYIVAGGTVTSGPVITTLSIVAGSGLTLVQTATPTTIAAGEVIRYHKIGSLLYRLQ